jgi:hypothetical protein
MSFQGPAGFVGVTGPTGVTGQKGLQGPAQGPTGASLYSGGLIPSLSNVSTSTPTITLTAATSGTHYNLVSGVTGVTISNDGGLRGTDAGCFWSFQNNSSQSPLTFTWAVPGFAVSSCIYDTGTGTWTTLGGTGFTIAILVDDAATPATYFTIL